MYIGRQIHQTVVSFVLYLPIPIRIFLSFILGSLIISNHNFNIGGDGCSKLKVLGLGLDIGIKIEDLQLNSLTAHKGETFYPTQYCRHTSYPPEYLYTPLMKDKANNAKGATSEIGAIFYRSSKFLWNHFQTSKL